MDANKNILIDLEALSALQMDSIKGFKYLSVRFNNPDIKTFFVKNEQISLKLWNELNEEIRNLQGKIPNKGTLKGAINHLWMKLKKDLLNKDLSKVLENIIFCEEFNIKSYESVLSNEAPEKIKMRLKTQLNTLNLRLGDITQLKHRSEDIK